MTKKKSATGQSEPSERDTAPLNVRISKRTIDRLRRAAVERKIRGDQPFTQQAIVEEALQEWLRARSRSE